MVLKQICRPILTIYCLFQLNNYSYALNYRELFGGNYLLAEKKANELRPIFQKYANISSEDSRMMEAMVFPEIIRYNKVYDIIETKSLLTLYSRFGSTYANFSIGILQMKPSFAKSIEIAASNYKQQWIKTFGFDKIANQDNYKNRRERVIRIDNLDWELKYLVAMIKCVKHLHANTWNTLTQEKKLIFIATAYNCGWNKSADMIISMSRKSFYHLNPLSKGIKYNFSDIALFRYRELI